MSTTFQRKRSQGDTLLVAKSHALEPSEIDTRSRSFDLFERRCLAKAATVDDNGEDIFCTVGRVQCHALVLELKRDTSINPT